MARTSVPMCTGGVCPAGMMRCDRVSPGRELRAWCRVQSCSQRWRQPRPVSEAAPLEKVVPSRRPFWHSFFFPFIIIHEESQELCKVQTHDSGCLCKVRLTTTCQRGMDMSKGCEVRPGFQFQPHSFLARDFRPVTRPSLSLVASSLTQG